MKKNAEVQERQTFSYFKVEDAEMFTFYRIPKTLFTHPLFKKISTEAKVLYGIMLDRMSLSRKNGWIDEEGHVYIVFTAEDVMELLGCGRQKAFILLGELDGGIGLIKRQRRGLGRANITYVMDFRIPEPQGPDRPEKPDYDHVSGFADAEPAEPEMSGAKDPSSIDIQKNHTSGCVENHTSGCIENHTSGCVENHTSESMEIILPEVWKSYTNDTEYKNNTEYLNNTEESNIEYLSYPSSESSAMATEPRLAQKPDVDGGTEMNPIPRNEDMSDPNPRTQDDTYKMCVKIFQKRLETLIPLYGVEKINQVINLIAGAMTSRKTHLKICGESVPIDIVRQRLIKVRSDHVAYVLDSIMMNNSPIRNMRGYLLTSLYNSTQTLAFANERSAFAHKRYA